MINRRRAQYEAAKAEAEKKIRQSDDFCYLWAELRKALELFDDAGKIKELASRQAEIKAILELMGELGCQKLKLELKSFAAGLENYWSYYQRAEALYRDLLGRYPRARGGGARWRLADRKTSDQQQRLRS